MLTEPALTNVGIVLAEDGFHARLRELTREHGTLLVIDETHTLCCGPGGYTAEHGLDPDLLTIGKPIAGGIPVGAYGMSEAVAERVLDHTVWDAADEGGVGGTLAGNALSLAAIRATLARGADRARLRAHDRAGATIRGRGRRGDRRARASLAGDAARMPRRVHVRARAGRAPAPRRPPRSTPSSTA